MRTRNRIRGLLTHETQLGERVLEILNRGPRPNHRVLTLVRRISLELIGPSSAPGEWQQRTMMQPGQAHFGFGARPSSDDDAGIAGKGHQQVAGITHAARNEDAARPIIEIDVVRRHDADHQSAGCERPLGSKARGRASTAAHQGDSKPRQQLAHGARQLVSSGTRICASQDTDLPCSRSTGDSSGRL
jgi:hypothetical protein